MRGIFHILSLRQAAGRIHATQFVLQKGVTLMTSIVYQVLIGVENPTRASLPFLMAAASKERGDDPEIALAGDAVVLIKDAIINSVVPVGWPPLKELFQKVVDLGIPVYI